MKYLYIFLAFTIIGCYSSNHGFIPDEQITDMYSSYVEEWKKQCVVAFDKAEKEVLQPNVIPTPDDGTNPDPAKCICKGTGVIVQGDGHRTPCPFHGHTHNKVNK
jgi:hypothetical protein